MYVYIYIYIYVKAGRGDNVPEEHAEGAADEEGGL